MDFLSKLERKFGKYAIPNLMRYIIIGQVIVFFSVLLSTFTQGSGGLVSLFYFDPNLIIRGQIWRLFTFVFIPNTFTVIWFIFGVLLYYSIGNTLEQVWGSFRFNIYYLLGIIFNMLGLLFVQLIFFPNTGSYIYALHSTSITTYLNLSLFLAYAALFPNVEFLLYGILPIKVKYLAFFDIALLLFSFIQGDFASRVLIIVSILNFLLFFGKQLLDKRPTQTQKNFRAAQKRELKQGPPIQVAFHKCTVCGKTELTDPDMEFRYCSKCNGNYEYCMDHLHNHEHIE